MAKGFRVSPTEFIDYLPSDGGAGSGSSSMASPFGNLEVLPEDYGVLDEVLSEYSTAAQSIAGELQQDPSRWRDMRPQIQQLQQNLMRDMSRGRIAAMINSKKEYDTLVKEITEDKNLDPADKQEMINSISIDPFSYDPATGRGRRIVSPKYLKSWTPDQVQKAITDLGTKVEKTTLEDPRLKGIGKIGERSAGAYEQVEGIAYQTVVDALTGGLSPEIAEDLQRTRRQDYERGAISREQYEAFDERDFFKDGKLNLNTTLGRQIDAFAKSRASEIAKSKLVTDKPSGSGSTAQAQDYGRMHNMLVSVLTQGPEAAQVVGKFQGSKDLKNAVRTEIESLPGPTFEYRPIPGQPGAMMMNPFTIKIINSNGSVKRIEVKNPDQADKAYWEMFSILSNSPNEAKFSRPAMEEVRKQLMAGKTMSDLVLSRPYNAQGGGGGSEDTGDDVYDLDNLKDENSYDFNQ